MVEIEPDSKQMDEKTTTIQSPLWPRGVHSEVPKELVQEEGDGESDRCPTRLGATDSPKAPQCLYYEGHQGPHRYTAPGGVGWVEEA